MSFKKLVCLVSLFGIPYGVIAQAASQDVSGISCVTPYRYANAKGLALGVPAELTVKVNGYRSCSDSGCRDYSSVESPVLQYVNSRFSEVVDALINAMYADRETQLKASRDFYESAAILRYVYLLKIADTVEEGLCKPKSLDNWYFWEWSRQRRVAKSMAFMRVSSFSQPLLAMNQVILRYNDLAQKYLNGKIEESNRVIQLEAYLRINEFIYLSAKIAQLVEAVEPLADEDEVQSVPPISSNFDSLSGDLKILEETFQSVLKFRPELGFALKLMEDTL